MATTKHFVLPVRKPSLSTMILGFAAINASILGVLLFVLCCLSLLTSRHDPWLPFAFIGSLVLVPSGLYVIRKIRQKL